MRVYRGCDRSSVASQPRPAGIVVGPLPHTRPLQRLASSPQLTATVAQQSEVVVCSGPNAALCTAAAAAASLLRSRVAWKQQVQRHRTRNATADEFHLQLLSRSSSGVHFSVHWSTILREADELRARAWHRWRDVFLQQRRERQQQEALLALDTKAPDTASFQREATSLFRRSR